MTDTGGVLQIERTADAAVTVTLEYPKEEQPNGPKHPVQICLSVCMCGAILWFVTSHFFDPLFLALVISIAVSRICWAVIRAGIPPCSYVIRADRNGVVIRWSQKKGWQEKYVSRDRIRDIVLGFARYSGPGTGMGPQSWLNIRTTRFARNIHCLHNIGGNHLAHVADALRAALSMPARTWP